MVDHFCSSRNHLSTTICRYSRDNRWPHISGIEGGNIFASMAQSVEQSSTIVCFMTEGYQSSANGERELTYADQKNVTIIPCLLQGHYEPTGKPKFSFHDFVLLA